MFTPKRLFFSLGFLFLTVIIGWTTWNFIIVRPKLIGNPIVRYNTESQITTNDTVDAAVIEKSQIGKNIKEHDTSETHKEPKVMSQSVREENKNTTASSTQKESDKYTDYPPKSNDKKLTAEELAKRRAEAKMIIKNYKIQVNELLNSTNELKKQSERSKASYNRNEMRAKLVKRLNSLSAEEQKAYFEDIKSGKAIDDALEKMMTAFKEEGIPDSFIGVYFELLKPQLAQKFDAEKHLEELRADGFKPKF